MAPDEVSKLQGIGQVLDELGFRSPDRSEDRQLFTKCVSKFLQSQPNNLERLKYGSKEISHLTTQFLNITIPITNNTSTTNAEFYWQHRPNSASLSWPENQTRIQSLVSRLMVLKRRVHLCNNRGIACSQCGMRPWLSRTNIPNGLCEPCGKIWLDQSHCNDCGIKQSSSWSNDPGGPRTICKSCTIGQVEQTKNIARKSAKSTPEYGLSVRPNHLVWPPEMEKQKEKIQPQIYAKSPHVHQLPGDADSQTNLSLTNANLSSTFTAASLAIISQPGSPLRDAHCTEQTPMQSFPHVELDAPTQFDMRPPSRPSFINATHRKGIQSVYDPHLIPGCPLTPQIPPRSSHSVDMPNLPPLIDGGCNFGSPVAQVDHGILADAYVSTTHDGLPLVGSNRISGEAPLMRYLGPSDRFNPFYHDLGSETDHRFPEENFGDPLVGLSTLGSGEGFLEDQTDEQAQSVLNEPQLGTADISTSNSGDQTPAIPCAEIYTGTASQIEKSLFYRLLHGKGCQTCLEWKWRCDEQRPICGPCKANFRPCEWLPAQIIEGSLVRDIVGRIIDEEPTSYLHSPNHKAGNYITNNETEIQRDLQHWPSRAGSLTQGSRPANDIDTQSATEQAKSTSKITAYEAAPAEVTHIKFDVDSSTIPLSNLAPTRSKPFQPESRAAKRIRRDSNEIVGLSLGFEFMKWSNIYRFRLYAKSYSAKDFPGNLDFTTCKVAQLFECYRRQSEAPETVALSALEFVFPPEFQQHEVVLGIADEESVLMDIRDAIDEGVRNATELLLNQGRRWKRMKVRILVPGSDDPAPSSIIEHLDMQMPGRQT